MLEKGKIGTKQFAVLIIFIIIGDMLLVLPATVSGVAKQDSWISGLLGLMIGVAVYLFLFRYVGYFAGATLIHFHRSVLGRWLGGMVSVAYLLFFIGNLSAVIREVGDFMTMQILIKTPIQVVLFLMIFILLWGVKSGLETFTRAAEVFFWVYSLLFMVLIVTLLPQIEPDRLEPIMGHGILPGIHGALYTAGFSFCEASVFMMIMPYVVKRDHLKRDFLLAACIGGTGIWIILVLCILVLSSDLTEYHFYPSYVLAQKISIGHIVERVEAILAINWIISSYFKCIVYFYGFILSIAEFLKLRDFQFLSIPAGMVVFGFAYIVSPSIMYYNKELLPPWVYWDFCFAFVIPLFVFTVYHIKRNWLKQRNKKSPPSRLKWDKG